MKSLSHQISLTLLGLLLSACSNNMKQEVAVDTPAWPAWYLQPPSNNESVLYGVGVGDDRQQAELAAVQHVIGQLSMRIRGSQRLEQSSELDVIEYVQRESKETIQAQTVELTNVGYAVSRVSKAPEKQIVVEVTIDRPLLQSTLEKNVSAILTEIDSWLARCENDAVICKLEATEKYNRLTSQSSVLPVIQNLSGSSELFSRYKDAVARMQQFIAKDAFVNLDCDDCGHLRAGAEEALLRSRIRPITGAADIQVRLSETSRVESSRGLFVVYLEVQVRFLEGGRTRAYGSLELKEASSVDKEHAMQRARAGAVKLMKQTPLNEWFIRTSE